MSKKDKILDDIARVAGGTVTVMSDIAKNVRQDVKSRAYEMASNLDLVPREDFEALEVMLKETRNQLEQQTARIDALEKKCGLKTEAKTGTTRKPKKAASKKHKS